MDKPGEEWLLKYIDAIKSIDIPAITPEEYDQKLGVILDRVYSDGYSDGVDEEHESEPPEPLPWHDLD
jgi:hypothetical protein